jgi:hypothetical protein
MPMIVVAKLDSRWTVDETISLFGETNASPLEGTNQVTEQYVTGTSGTANAINNYFIKAGTNSVTLAASGTVTYVLTSLTDPLGRAVTFAGGVRGMWYKATTRVAGDFVTMGAAGTAPWTSLFGGTTPTLKLFKYFCIEADLTDKYVVTAASNEQLKFTNSGTNSLTFEFGLIGCSS